MLVFWMTSSHEIFLHWKFILLIQVRSVSNLSILFDEFVRMCSTRTSLQCQIIFTLLFLHIDTIWLLAWYKKYRINWGVLHTVMFNLYFRRKEVCCTLIMPYTNKTHHMTCQLLPNILHYTFYNFEPYHPFQHYQPREPYDHFHCHSSKPSFPWVT